MVFAGPRGSLSSQQTLELANVYLEGAFNAIDSDIALVLCHDTEVSLSQAKKSAKEDKNPAVTEGIATAYIGLGKLLESFHQVTGAQANFKKAEKLVGNIYDLTRPTDTYRPSSIKGTLHYAGECQDEGSVKPLSLEQRQAKAAATFPAHIFAENITPSTVEMKLPELDERLNNTPQLVCCLGLLKVAHSPDTKLEPTALKWMQAVEKDTEEQERLHGIATDLIRAFKREEIKDAKVVSEVACLAPVLDKEMFHDLLREFYSGVDASGLLNFQQLEGLAQLIQGADQGHLSADDLVKVLELLSTRLMDTHQQSSQHMHQLTLAVSHVLDAMADTKVTDLNREKLHEPLSSYLSGLKKSSDPFLVYQAAYAYQALLCVPDDETTWQAAMRRTGKVISGVSGLVSAVKGLDLVKFIEGLEDIQKGVSGASKVAGAVKSAYDKVTTLVAGGQGFMDALKEGLSFERKRDWYSALRGADALIQDGELATFKRLVCGAPCRYDPAFQWGVCQRLGEIATNPKWDALTRQNAIAFLGEIYRNDEMWGQRANVKQWILNILMQLSSSGGVPQFLTATAETLLRELEASEDIKKRALYRVCRENGPIVYPLKVALPEPASPSLLDRVQNRPDIEGHLRILRKQRTKERGNAVYIPPQAKSGLQAADNTRFQLMDKVKKFLHSDQKVFLLLGDSGAGKSTFSRELEFDLWQSYKIKTGRIPLHINLPTIDKPEHDLIAKQLRRNEFTEPQIREMKHHRNFILICDGYDESQQTHNLYASNQLNETGEWDAQMVISCRSEYLGSDYRDRFQPGNRNQRLDSRLFQEAVITPFSNDQIQDYIKQYVSINQPLWRLEDYKQALDLIPSLTALVKNPFLMALSLDVLPRMVDPGQHLSSTRVTRVALYDHFVEQWLERGKKRLSEKDMSPLTKEAFEKLSAEGFTLNGIGYLKQFAVAIYKEQGGQPVVEYSKLMDEGSWKDRFFNCKEMRLLHEACPMTRSGNQHRFIHRSILEYGLARAVFDPQDRKNRVALEPLLSRRASVGSNLSFEIQAIEEGTAMYAAQEPDPTSPLVWRNFVNDHSLLQFLEERVQQEQVFKDQLHAYIEYSKKDKKWRIAAANAITILVRAGVQFIGADLRGIRIPGADLSYGVFESVQLQDADMRKVNLRGVRLSQTNLSRTDMTGVQFGELPYLTMETFVSSCAFSPDGKLFVVGLNGGDIHVYSISNWEMLRIQEGHGHDVRRVVYSSDGNLLCSGSRDKTVRIWIMESGVCQHILNHPDEVNCVAYSPQGNQVASACDDMTIRLWDPATGNCFRTLSGHEGIVMCVVYSPKGDQIASGGGNGDFTVRLWNVVTGECSRVIDGHSDNVWGIAFSPHGDQVASASCDKTVRIWDVKSGYCRHTFEGHIEKVYEVLYSLKGDQVISGSKDGTVRVWDVQSGSCLHTLTGHTDGVYCIAYSPKGDMVASGSFDNTVRLWDVSVGGSGHISSGHNKDVNDIKCSPKGNLIATCSKDSTIRLWDVETGACIRTFSGHSETVHGVAFSPQGNRIASGSYDSTVRLWDADTGICQHILTGHTGMIWSIAYSPQYDQVASASEDKTIRLWNATTGDYQGTLNGHTDGAMGVAYSPNGSIIATCSKDGTTKLWDVGTMACTSTLTGHGSWVYEVAFSPRGEQLASASADWVMGLWSVETGECYEVLAGHESGVSRVAYSHNGDLLASGSWDKTLRLWDVTGQCRAVVQNFQGAVTGITWIPSTDGNYLVTGCEDGSVLKWQVIEKEGQCHVKLCWTAANGSFTVTGASIQDVQGLTSLNKQLLKQRGAEGEPENLFREASKKLITMASVVSQMRQPSDRMDDQSPQQAEK
ncbi:MAG: WD40-repeat-containing domain protein [Benniella sp.]|nr:MAG: WD40-repeat-containing domain protein [Benniella sp.]